jgi:hypothetical protein
MAPAFGRVNHWLLKPSGVTTDTTWKVRRLGRALPRRFYVGKSKYLQSSTGVC